MHFIRVSFFRYNQVNQQGHALGSSKHSHHTRYLGGNLDQADFISIHLFNILSRASETGFP